MGDATESKNELGIGWFSPNGELLAVQFDEVAQKEDNQFLVFNHYRVEIFVKKGKVKYQVEKLNQNQNKSIKMPHKIKKSDYIKLTKNKDEI